ncbi:hypothetical protein Btru_039203 [Bulinus truncatus]|nr:hypothetical protein Btru_039203 [Bulinus truncatus]
MKKIFYYQFACFASKFVDKPETTDRLVDKPETTDRLVDKPETTDRLVEQTRDHRQVSGQTRDHRQVSGQTRDHRKVSGQTRDHRQVSGQARDHRQVSGQTKDHRQVSGCKPETTDRLVDKPETTDRLVEQTRDHRKVLNNDPNCISHGGTQEFPEKWCINRLIEYKNQGSLLKVFSGVTNPLISFSNATGNFTVLKSGTFFVYGSIPVISNSSRQLVGVFKNKDILIACPSSGYGIIRPENHGSSTTRRICNMNGVMRLNQNDQLQVKTLENELTIHLDVDATISWILLR